MPSARLYEGDMAAIMKLIEKMQRELENLNIALAAVASNVKQIPAVSAKPVVNQSTVLSRNIAGANAEITSRDSHHVTEDFARDFPGVNNDKNSSGDEIANVNFLTTISHTRRPTSKYRKRDKPTSFNKLDDR